MTITNQRDPSTDEAGLTASPPEDQASSGSGAAAPKERSASRRRGAAVLLAAVVFLLTGWLFIDPVAHVWFHTHQGQLSSQPGSVLRPSAGAQVAVLQNVAIGLNVVVAEGDGTSELRGGPGHDPHTPDPGHLGNSVIFGHAAEWGAPFKSLNKLSVGDRIYLKTRDSRIYIYTVRTIEKVDPDNVGPFRASRDYRLTLVTDAGGAFSDRRLVVVAVSGSVAAPLHHSPPVAATPTTMSKIFNGYVGGFLLRGAVAAAVFWAVRRRHRIGIAIVLAAPIALATLLSMYLELDLFLSPLA